MTLDDSIESLKGVGDKIKNYFNEEKIFKVKDLINFMPKKYNVYKLSDLNEDFKIITVKGIICSNIISRKISQRVSGIIFYLLVNGKKVKIIGFGKDYLKFQLKSNMTVVCHGQYKSDKNEIILQEIFFDSFFEFVKPVYNLKNINDSFVTKLLDQINLNTINFIDIIPQNLVDKYRLLTYKEYIIKSHYPKDEFDVRQIYRRSKYQLYFKKNLEMESLRYYVLTNKKEPKIVDKSWIYEFIDGLEFELTNSQKQAINDIVSDMKSDVVMNRLIQGDVSSGKTIIALVCAYLNYKLGYQSIIMAPTEILAFQHFKNFSSLLSKYNVCVELLVSQINSTKKDDIIDRLENGRINILIATHSVLYHNIKYHKLGLVVIDEQHRFGVSDRQKLLNEHPKCDAMYLSATPIPRSLGLTSFGDLDITSMKDRPLNRKKVKTELINDDELEIIYDDIKKKIMKNEQAFAVVSAISSDQRYDIEKICMLFKNNVLGIRIGVINGQMDKNEKDKIMLDFKNKKYDILVATTVIEVGIDIRNATAIYIFDANCFGLSTLHQLRGRVGRNGLDCVCYLISEKNSDRLKFLTQTDDCFEISEYDLKLRGPGEIFGVLQSGFKELDINQDINIYNCAKLDAKQVFNDYISGKINSSYLDSIIMKFRNKKIKLN